MFVLFPESKIKLLLGLKSIVFLHIDMPVFPSENLELKKKKKKSNTNFVYIDKLIVTNEMWLDIYINYVLDLKRLYSKDKIIIFFGL